MKKFFFSALLWAVLAAAQAPADVRTEPIDVILALDKSLSMEEEISAVIEYVNNYVIDQLLIPGDYFMVIAFYGKTEVPVSMKIEGPADKERAKKAVSALIANGRFTDIGNALDVLNAEFLKLGETGRKKHLMLITDGIQEAPPSSRYYSPEGKFNHEFLENAKTIQRQGWKIHILGIGTQEQARELAQTLSAQYTELTEAPSAQELIEQTQGFLTGIEAVEGATLSPVNYFGWSRLALALRSKGYSEPAQVEIGEVLLSLPGEPARNILRRPAALEVPPDAALARRLPVQLPARLPVGTHEGTLEFVFSGEGRFTPVVMPVSFQVQSFAAGLWYLIAAAALIVLVLLVLLIVRLAQPGKARSRFRLVVEGRKRPGAEKVYSIREGEPLFLEEAEGGLQVVRSKSPGTLARLAAVPKGVRLTVLRGECFPRVGILPPNVLDRDLRVRLTGKKDLTVRLASVK